MEQVLFSDNIGYGNILYIGDDPKACLSAIEKFTARVRNIESRYIALAGADIISIYLQRSIQYHFEGGIVMFKFRCETEIHPILRKECLSACQDIIFEQYLIQFAALN